MEAVVLFFVSFLLLVTGCVSPGASPAATQEAAAVPTLDTGATSVSATPEPMTTSAQSEIPPLGLTRIAEPLSPEPQTVEFQAADGQVLHGFYYPPALKPASLVVLMHWLPGRGVICQITTYGQPSNIATGMNSLVLMANSTQRIATAIIINLPHVTILE